MGVTYCTLNNLASKIMYTCKRRKRSLIGLYRLASLPQLVNSREWMFFTILYLLALKKCTLKLKVWFSEL